MVQVLLAIHDPGMEVNGLFNYSFTFMEEPICECSQIHMYMYYIPCSVYCYMCVGWRQLGLYSATSIVWTSLIWNLDFLD